MRRYILILQFALVSAASSQILDKKFEDYVEANLEKHGVVGAGVAVVRDGKMVYAKGFGYRDLKNKLPVTPKTLWGIGSTTKAFTATAIGLLVNDGKLFYDVPVKAQMPEFELSHPVSTETATLRDLLGHTTGIPRHDLGWYGASGDRSQIFNKLFGFPFHRGLREEWEYNNLMYIAAGVMVDKFAGMSWEAYTKLNILIPLEMKNTNFSVEDSKKSDDFSYGYADSNSAGELVNIDVAGPAGSINSNLEEMSHWLWANISKGQWNGMQLLPANIFDETQKPYSVILNDIKKKEADYGQGWMIYDFRGKKMIFHDGGIPGFLTAVAFIPEIKTGVIAFVNTPKFQANSLMAYAFDLILGLDPIDRINRPAPKPPVKPEKKRRYDPLPLPVSHYTGIYEQPGYGELEIAPAANSEKGQQIIVKYHGIDIPLRHDHDNIFVLGPELNRDKDAYFELGTDGKPESFFFPFEPSISPIEFRRK